MSDIDNAKLMLPLPALMHRVGLGQHAKKSARCPFHDDRHNSFSVWQNGLGLWFWKCHAGCGGGDEITLLGKHKDISNAEATKLFLEMSGLNGATSPASKPTSKLRSTSELDWPACVQAFTSKHIERLAKWRGYSIEFCRWLNESGLVGLFNCCIAFPVRDDGGSVVVAHYRQKDGDWKRYPTGFKTRPIIIGELLGGEPIHIFESQWDAFAFMDVSGERSGIIITLGAGNGSLVSDLITPRSTVYAWTQNDAAGKKWQMDVCANTKAAVKRAKVPAPHKDLNDWTRAGATANNLLAAIRNADFISRTEKPLSATLDSVVAFLLRYVVFPHSEQPIAIALWIAHAWALDAFDCTAYLHICSPEKRSGKTRLLDCLELLVSKPWRAVSPSEAVLYRKIEADQPTLLLDEVDTVFPGKKDERKEPLRALLNAGFERNAKVPRCVGQGSNYQVQEFGVFCAKAFAGIGKLPDTITDRCIPIRLIRRSREESIQRFRKRDTEIATAPIRTSLAAWAAQVNAIEKLRTSRPGIPTELGDRQADICEPLLAIADLAGGEWPQRSRTALIALCAGENEDDSQGVTLLAAVREIFDADGLDRLATAELLKQLVNQETEAPWAGWWEQDLKNGNTRGPAARLARLLKPHGIKAKVIRLSDGSTPRGYMREDFEEAWKRYCPGLKRPENATTQQRRAFYL